MRQLVVDYRLRDFKDSCETGPLVDGVVKGVDAGDCDGTMVVDQTLGPFIAGEGLQNFREHLSKQILRTVNELARSLSGPWL